MPLARVWYWALVAGVYGAVPVLVGVPPWAENFDPSSIIDGILALIVSAILLVRILGAYQRSWEARTLWSKLVTASRALAIKAKTFVEPDELERRRLRALIVGFAVGLKHHLRGHATLAAVPGFESAADEPEHVPAYLVEQLYGIVSAWRSAGRISSADSWMLDREARELVKVAGGCERIRDTLTAQSFPTLARQALVLYLLYLPWSLASDHGYVTIPLVVLAAYFVVAAEAIAYDVERPFGRDDDHLDLESMCAGVDASVTEILER